MKQKKIKKTKKVSSKKTTKSKKEQEEQLEETMLTAEQAQELYSENIKEEAQDEFIQPEEPMDNKEDSITMDTILNQHIELPDTHQMSKGALLKKARLEKGFSLELVHEATKIPMDALRAIEEGYTVRTLSSFYYKGFLKIYARFLEIDVAEIVDDYHVEVLPKHKKSNVEEFDLGSSLSKVFNRQRMRQIVVLCGIIFALFLLFKLIGFFTNRSDDKPRTARVEQTQTQPQQQQAVVQQPTTAPPVQEEQRPPAPVQQPKPVESRPATQPQPVQPVIVPSQPVVQKNVVLTVRAKNNSWLRVKADNEIVFQSTLRKGAVETWMADEELELSGRNINELEFELNGKMIGALGRQDRKAKRVVVTKEGLKVTK